MEVIKTPIEGVVIIEPRLFNDGRGYFFESFSQRDFEQQVRTVHLSRTMKANQATEYYVDFISRNHPLPKANW